MITQMPSATPLPPETERRLTARGLVGRSSDVMSGALVFNGTRVPVGALFDYLIEGSSVDSFLDDFPTVERQVVVTLLEQLRTDLAA